MSRKAGLGVAALWKLEPPAESVPFPHKSDSGVAPVGMVGGIAPLAEPGNDLLAVIWDGHHGPRTDRTPRQQPRKSQRHWAHLHCPRRSLVWWLGEGHFLERPRRPSRPA